MIRHEWLCLDGEIVPYWTEPKAKPLRLMMSWNGQVVTEPVTPEEREMFISEARAHRDEWEPL